jgi:hypothetical protein
MVSPRQQQLARIGATGLAAVLVLGVASCTRPLVPSTSAPSAGATSSSGNPHYAPVRWHKPVLGADLYATNNYPAHLIRRDGTRDLTYMKAKLKVTSVGIAWNFYTTRDHSNTVGQAAQSLSPANVRLLTRLAKADHLTVEYRPLIKVEHGSPWEGYIRPMSQAKWFASFYHAELPYLRIAQRYHVREFVLGTELEYLNSSLLWPSFIQRVRHVYKGIVSYAAYGPQFFPAAGRHLVRPLQELGVTGYPGFNLPNNASVPQLVAAWKHVFAAVPAAMLERTAIDETGIPAINGAYQAPALWAKKGKLNPTVQARFFTSECMAVKAMHLRAIYFWNVNLTDYPKKPPFPSPPTFEGKKGAKAIAGCAKLFG